MGRKRSGGRCRSTTPAKRPRTQWSDSPFGKLLESAGMTLNGEHQNELGVEPAVFQRQLASTFRRQSDLIQATEEFCEGLREYIDDPVRFRMSLLPTKIAMGGDVMARSMGLDSLLRLLLGVECIQPSVVNALLERVPEYMDDSSNVDSLGVREYHQMPQLILSQLKWLGHIVKGTELCGNLLEVVSIAPLGIQREIVSALPEVLDDAQHNHAALELKSLLRTNSDLTAAVIDALSNLNVETETAAEVLDVALGRVSSANLADLPTVIKFIMQQVTPKNAQEIITELRERLDFESTFIPAPAACSTPRSTQLHLARVSTESSDQFVVFDTIRSSICFQKAVADGWMNAIEAVAEVDSHRAIDIFVLFILHSISSRRKAVESLFCTKIRSRLFSEELMSTVFGSHTGALRGFFPSILSLCETLLCSSSPSIAAFATSLYQHVFGSFDVYCQQEVIGALITHIGSGMPSEIDHALDALGALVETQGKAMQRFAILIKGVLDYLEHLAVGQIRRLYQVLSVLAFSSLEEVSSVQDELHTLIRKQLSHTEAKYRRMGVMGAVMIVQQLARRRDVTDLTLQAASASQARDSTLPPARKKQAISMLDDVMRSCSHSPESSILFYDEMSSVVRKGTLDTAVLHYLGDEVTTKYQDTFLVESGDPLASDLGLPMQLAYSLDSAEEGSIAVNLLPLGMQQADRGQERGAGLRALPAHFRLLSSCERALSDNLEGIDALLGSPVVVCSKEKLETEVFEDLPITKRHDICLSLFHLLNWFRELVCAFAGEEDVDMRGKVVIRLQDITELQSQLESCMTATPGFLPPSVCAEEVTPPTARGRKGSKSSKGDTTAALSVTSATQNIDKDTTSLDKTASTATVSIDRIRPYFRELDLGSFAPLRYDPLSRTVMDSESRTKEQEELKLRPPQLLFLLRDLNDKLSSSLTAFGGKSMAARSSRSSTASYTTDQLVATMTKLMPALCEHLENSGAFFQAQIAESDGMLDVESGHRDFPVLCTCLHLLLRTMATFFAWSPLSDPHYEEQLWASVRAIAARTSQSSSQLQAALPHLARAAVKYLEQFSGFLPTLTSAHSLAKVLVALCKTCKAEHLKKPIAIACGSLLKRPWRAGESGSQRSEALDYLLRYHLEWADDPLALVESIAGEGVVELMGEEPQEESSAYPTLSTTTFPNYYRCMMAAVVSQVKAVPPPGKKTTPTAEVLTERFHLLEVSAKVLNILVNLVKSFDRRSVFVAVLKYGKQYVEAFLKSGMSVLSSLFRQRKDDVIALLKTLQQSTRNLQHFCSHSKVTKDITLTNHVPLLKKCLEMLLFRVKEMLTNHNCQEAFWVGNLKNRDIQGQEILSQVSQTSAGEDGDDESEAGDTNSTSTDRREPILSDED